MACGTGETFLVKEEGWEGGGGEEWERRGRRGRREGGGGGEERGREEEGEGYEWCRVEPLL